MTPSIEDKVRRPVKYLTAAKQRYPDLWKRVDLLRANRDKVQQEHPWPPWCYLPLGGAAGILGPPAPGFGKLLANMEASKIATLASWRLAKDIYIFDETVLEELWDTPIDGDIPIDVLYKLPTWCAYIAFPAPRAMEGGAVHGFFVHLNYSGMPMLLLAQDYSSVEQNDAMTPFPLELHEGRSLLECLTTMHEKAKAKHGPPSIEIAKLQPREVMRWMQPMLSLTIYLCSTSAEIRLRDPLRGLKAGPRTKKTKKGVRTFVPDQPQVWEVAFRIGATLRAATAAAAAASPGTGEGGTHASPRPHIRRAHWHSYWTGPKAAVGKAPVPAREVIVKWIPPIAVAMGPDGEAIPTVHRVTR